MNEFIEKTNYREKKVTSLEIIVTGTKDKPYFEIKYKEVGKEDYSIGYGSYDLNNVFDWKEDCFEIVNQLAEEYSHCTLCYLQSPCEYQNENVEMPVEYWERGWIPCSERLPNKEEYLKNDGRFIVTDGNRRYQSVYDIYQGKFRTLKLLISGWVFAEDNCVIAWQPLPKPYQPKEGEE